MKKVVFICVMTLVFILSSCDGNILDNPSSYEPEITIMDSGFFGDLSSLGVDSEGCISFADNEAYDAFLLNHLKDAEGNPLVNVCYSNIIQNLKPEFQAEYDKEKEAVTNWCNAKMLDLIDKREKGEISDVEYSTRYRELDEVCNLELKKIDAKWESLEGVWGDLRISVLVKNLTDSKVTFYPVYASYKKCRFFGPVTLEPSEEIQSIIITSPTDGNMSDLIGWYINYIYY